MFENINQAIAKASILHEGQKRRGIPLPYLVHPYAVAAMLAFYISDKDALVAALMHDTVEDTEYSFVDLERDFGTRVKEIVYEVTEKTDINLLGRSVWRARKEEYIKTIKTASFEGVAVSWADKVHNLMSMVDAYQECGEDFIKSFNAGAGEMIWFFRELQKVYKKRLPLEMAQKYNEIFKQVELILKKYHSPMHSDGTLDLNQASADFYLGNA